MIRNTTISFLLLLSGQMCSVNLKTRMTSQSCTGYMLYIYIVPKHGSYCVENLHSPKDPVTAACLGTRWNGHSIASCQKREFVDIWEESGKRWIHILRWYSWVPVAGPENSALNCHFSCRDWKRRPKFVTDDKPLHYDSSTKNVLGPMKHGTRFSYVGVLCFNHESLAPCNLWSKLDNEGLSVILRYVTYFISHLQRV